MAKKKETELSYLQMPLPSGSRTYKQTKISWSGLNMRQTIDSGELSKESNISTLEAPYLTPSQRHIEYVSGYTYPISIFGFDDFLIVIYRKSGKIRLDYITVDEDGDISNTYTGIIKPSGATSSDEYARCMVQFNVYDTPTDPVDGDYIKKLLLFPDKKSMYMHIIEADSDPEDWDDDDLADARRDVLYHYDDYYYTVELDDDGNRYVNQSGGSGYFEMNDMDVLVKSYYNNEAETDESGATIYPPSASADTNYYYKNTYNSDVYKYCEYETEDGGTAYGWKVSVPPAMPDIKYATVYLSRLFGVDDTRVYASGYNDYTNWNLDTVGEYNESNAWCSPAQSNVKAGGSFTGITTFQSHIVCFKNDFMHEIYNTYNPFRIQDIFAEGTIDNRTIQDVDGSLIFVSDNDVKVYTGSNPKSLGYYLNIEKYTKAVSGTDGRCYYLYCEDADGIGRLLCYDTFVGEWSEQTVSDEILGFAHNKNGMYYLSDDGAVYQMDSGRYNQSWSFETDLITRQSSTSDTSYATVNIKHIRKIQMLADIASGANIKVYFLYDDEVFNKNTSHLVYESSGYGRKPIRVKPRQTAHYGIKLHIEGYGYAKLYELELFFEYGGDLYV